MIRLGVNIDHVATLRQARLGKEPDIVRTAVISEMNGANGITVHLREDRRHIQEKDVRILREIVTTSLNLEMATSEDVIQIALDVKPDMVTLVPEKRKELTTEGGLNLLDEEIMDRVTKTVDRLNKRGITVSLFIDPKPEIMKLSKATGAKYIEIHTGTYADAKDEKTRKEEYEKVVDAVKSAKVLGLNVNAGHGLNYENVAKIAAIKEIEELNIGHSIISNAVYMGLPDAVKKMKELMVDARGNL